MTGTFKNRFTGQLVRVDKGAKRVIIQRTWSLTMTQFKRAVKNGTFVKIAD